MELTDREIRGIGWDRYVTERRWWLRIGWIAFVGWFFGTTVYLFPVEEPTGVRMFGFSVLLLAPAALLYWWFTRKARAAGRKFLNEWIHDQASKRGLLDGTEYQGGN